MRAPATHIRLVALAGLLAGTLVGGLVTASSAPANDAPTPGIACGKGSLPEKVQGRAPKADYDSGRVTKGYLCNAVEVSHFGESGGFRVERYVDAAGHECAYYDTTLLVGTNFADNGLDGPGTYVMDMTDPAHPVHTDTLRTPAFVSPHESVRVNAKRGLIAADFANPAVFPGQVDIFDLKKDCRHPSFLSSTPTGVLGHESGFAPDGNTFYVASLYGHTLAAVVISNPTVPRTIWTTTDYQPHGVSISDDGNTLFIAEAPYDKSEGGDFNGLTILDVSQVQKRVVNPTVPIISRLTWPTISTPQNATPFTSKGHRYVLETDEFGSGANIGGARIIDIQDLKRPFVVSNLRLAVNQAKMQGPDLEADPGSAQPFQGYQAHYCSLPSRVDPQVIACSFIMSGLRVFDISNVKRPLEIAYFNKPLVKGPVTQFALPISTLVCVTAPASTFKSAPSQQARAGAFGMSAPAYDEKTGDIWYSDGNSGFYVVRLTGAAKRAKFAPVISNPGN